MVRLEQNRLERAQAPRAFELRSGPVELLEGPQHLDALLQVEHPLLHERRILTSLLSNALDCGLLRTSGLGHLEQLLVEALVLVSLQLVGLHLSLQDPPLNPHVLQLLGQLAMALLVYRVGDTVLGALHAQVVKLSLHLLLGLFVLVNFVLLLLHCLPQGIY